MTKNKSASFDTLLVGLSGLEPPTPTLSGWCSNLLSYNPMSFWWRQRDSNPSPHECKSCALPDELCPHFGLLTHNNTRIIYCQIIFEQDFFYLINSIIANITATNPSAAPMPETTNNSLVVFLFCF